MKQGSGSFLPKGWLAPFLFIAVPLLLLQVLVSLVFYQQAKARFDASIRLEQMHHLQMLNDDVRSEIDHAIDELLFLADQVRLHKALRNNGQREALGEDFLSFMNTTRLFDQVRLLNADGVEILRANYNNGHPKLIPAAHLQNKSQRYYFQQTRKLSAGAIYLSRLDLNVEHGQVERPYKPVLRLATPVVGRGGVHGVLVLNYRADMILKRLQSSDHRNVMLVNARGFPLRVSEDQQSWARFLAGNPADSLVRQRPLLWEAMQTSGGGVLQTADGDQFFFTHINLANYIGRPERRKFGLHASENWYLLIRYPAKTLMADLAQKQRTLLGVNLVSGSIILLLALLAASNIRRRRLAFDMVQASERQLRSIYEQTPLGYLCLNGAGVICEANDAAAGLLDQSSQALLGQEVRTFIDYSPDPLHSEETAKLHEFEISQADGTRRWIEFRCKSVFDAQGEVRYHCLLSDISSRREREHAQLQQARLQATERLAGGVAHLVNNYMTIIIGNADLLIERFHADKAAKTMLERIRTTVYKTSAIANDMLNYSRRGKLPFRHCEPEAIIADAVAASLPDDSHLQLDLATSLWPLQGDPARLVQVLRTLLENAAEAINADGHIRLSACNRSMTVEEAADLEGMQAGDFIEIRVEDDGCGIAEEAQEHLFEPFFSTKFQGRGLGLAAAYGIIKLHGGYLYVRSEPEAGTGFTIYLPAMAGAYGGRD